MRLVRRLDGNGGVGPAGVTIPVSIATEEPLPLRCTVDSDMLDADDPAMVSAADNCFTALFKDAGDDSMVWVGVAAVAMAAADGSACSRYL